MGEYTGVGGDVHSGAGIDDLLATEGMAELGNEMRAALEDSMAKVGVIDKLAKAGQPFDNLIQMGISEPNVLGAIQALSAQTNVLERRRWFWIESPLTLANEEAFGRSPDAIRQDFRADANCLRGLHRSSSVPASSARYPKRRCASWRTPTMPMATASAVASAR